MEAVSVQGNPVGTGSLRNMGHSLESVEGDIQVEHMRNILDQRGERLEPCPRQRQCPLWDLEMDHKNPYDPDEGCEEYSRKT